MYLSSSLYRYLYIYKITIAFNGYGSCFQTLQEVVNGGLPANYASPYCTMGLYIPRLLLGAYRFTTDNIVYVKPVIGDVDIGKTIVVN